MNSEVVARHCQDAILRDTASLDSRNERRACPPPAGNEMPLWQKVQSAPRDADGPVAQPVAEAVPDMSSVDPVAIEPASGPLWMKSHYKETTSMWQQVRAARLVAVHLRLPAFPRRGSRPLLSASCAHLGSAPLPAPRRTR